MAEPALVIMAAGMGSRYGGLKQMDPMDKEGHLIIDYSICDAIRAGFKKIVFIIKEENEAIFREKIGDRISKEADVFYAFQKLEDIPEGFQIPEGRVKPWGTGHAVLAARKILDGPFAVINSDDYYGRHAFQLIYDYLTGHEDDDFYRFAMVGYYVANTVTENGYVSRGVCTTDREGFLTSITERTRIEKRPEGIAYTEDDGATWSRLDDDTPVSMNMWGFSEHFLGELEVRFPAFLEKGIRENPLKCEYFLPFVVDELLEEKKATVKVLKTPDKWYGVTYKEDKAAVVAAFERMKKEGLYPENF
ncbi:MAG: sugar phosphate nucleotidyltransferase [Eubacterium sp.]|nr:sugar phosphate nucleotidyltransferase [Eubacterium sp.]